MRCISNVMKNASSFNFYVFLKAIPLCHWFSEDCPREPFFHIDYKLKSLQKLIEMERQFLSSFNFKISGKYVYHLYIVMHMALYLFRDFNETVNQIQSRECLGDPLIQIHLLILSQHTSKLENLIGVIDVRILIVGIILKLRNPKLQFTQPEVEKIQVKNCLTVVIKLWEKKESMYVFIFHFHI